MIKRFDLYLNTAELGVMHIADVALQEDHGVISTVGFRYTPDYLSHSQIGYLACQKMLLALRRSRYVRRLSNGLSMQSKPV